MDLFENAFGALASRIGKPIQRSGITIDPSHKAIPNHLVTRFLLGQYERDERSLIHSVVSRGDSVVELGGGLGIQSCITNRLLSEPNNHVVVEANPDLKHVLERHREINDCEFKIIQKAYSPTQETVTFGIRGSDRVLGSSQHRETDRAKEITTINLRRIANTSNFGEYVLICDIEGSEQELIKHEIDELSNRCSALLIEFHWPVGEIVESDVRDAKRRLESNGFMPFETAMSGRVVVYENSDLR